MCPRHVGGRYPTPGSEERAFAASLFYPFTHTTWRNVCTTSTRSRCASITASMDLYAIAVSSMTSDSLRHPPPAVALAWHSKVKRRSASLLDLARPAPGLHPRDSSECPFPATVNDRP